MINSTNQPSTGKTNVFIIRKYDFLKQKTNQYTKKRVPWKPEEDELLIRLVNQRSTINWYEISKHFDSRTFIQCEERWNKVLKPGLKKGKWSKEEDDLLLNYVKKFGPQNWAKLAVVLKGRTPKQIRDRWINNLNPKRINFKWTDDLDKILLQNYLIYGTKWTLISDQIFGTTENVVKNRFYSLLRSAAIRHSSKIYPKEESNVSVSTLKQEEVDERNNSFEEIDKYFNFFEYDDVNKSTSNEKSFVKLNDKVNKKTKKRISFSLIELLKFLPYLLEERGIEVTNSYEKQKEELSQIEKPINIKESVPIEQKDNNQNDSSFKNKMLSFTNILEGIEQKSRQNSFKIKSSIILNLQLSLLNRIFHRLKNQVVQRFFESFKENTLESLN